jgi:hypothetical protein
MVLDVAWTTGHFMCLSFDNIEVENVFAGEGGLKMGEWTFLIFPSGDCCENGRLNYLFSHLRT